ncbi:MAG TPA: SAM-dependent methyltransferase [Aliidongia sp.]|uniref:class I SAM-dependent methyltransferase n=1 Tax=Aliidongia sp. TaxID=1914230 RepID=UPI002DDC9451|nr:SAM-dependent methyltransferase [Aliidongia sp.]HEV2674910.1 SAM-dependent methyltransferase [Aliidongia sp.]
MKEGRSATAVRAAMRRAAHQLWDEPRIFSDQHAVRLIAGLGGAAISRSGPCWQPSIVKSNRALLAVRARFAEDVLADAVADGVRQFCILGAGLDTFSCRNSYEAQGLRIFEVDHPASQAWKLELLSKAGLQSSAIFVPVDFERQELSAELRSSGLNLEAPALFSCLGVASYLAEETFFGILGLVRSFPGGSGIVFDFPTPDSHLSFSERMVRRVVSFKLALQGEPAKTRFDPGALAASLTGLGFETTMLDAGAINSRYFMGRTDGLRMSNRSVLVHASV